MNPSSYSHIRAMLAITKASLRTLFRSPQSVFFSLFFPIVLIAIFGALGSKGGVSLDVAFDPKADTSNALYQTLKQLPVLQIETGSPEQINDRLIKGHIIAILDVQPKQLSGEPLQYDLHLTTSSASQKDLPLLRSVLKEVIHTINEQSNPTLVPYAQLSQVMLPGRPYKPIDFYLPGMLGFSLIGSAVFGVAFVLYSLRETLVLKRMYTTPIKRGYIILGESLARILFQLLTAVVIILFGTLIYGFTLSHGWITFVELLVLSFIGLLVFMGFGFLVSSFSKTQNLIPIYANIFMFPQYLLSGTFFPKTLFPEFLQNVVAFLPLTALNDAMRTISFEGAHLSGCLPQLAILSGWIVIVYTAATKTFRWE